MNIESYVCRFCGKDIAWNIDTGKYIENCKCHDHADWSELV
jgi:hypothetical protein